MFHLDNTSGVPEMPELNQLQSNNARWFGESNAEGGVSWPGRDWFNIVQAELLNVVTDAGIEPDKFKLNQVSLAISKTIDKRLSDLITINKLGGAFIIFDDANPETKADLIPIAIANDFRAGLAVYAQGIQSGYHFVSLPEAIDFSRKVNGEILSHSLNGFTLDNTVDLTVGEAWIESSQLEFSQMGFNPHGFVAPNSVLDAKFLPKLKSCYDYAFIRSATMTVNTNAVNLMGANRYNLVRVAIESITFERAKQYVDYAKSVAGYVCFYTHKYVSWLPNLMQYIKENIPNITPSEWIGGQFGLIRNTGVLPTENLINNTSFQSLTAEVNPFNWTLDLSGLTSPTKRLAIGNGVGNLDIEAKANLAGQAGYLRYRYVTGPIGIYTPICFCINASSYYSNDPAQVTTNTKATLTMRLISATGTVLRESPVRQYVVASQRPLLYVNDGFTTASNAAYIDIEVKFETINDGDLRIILSAPQLERAGLPTPYKYSQFPSSYFSRIRRTTGLSIAANTITTVVFNTLLEGSNVVYNTTTGVLSSSDGRNYLLQVNLGFNGLAPGDVAILYLQVDGVAIYPAYSISPLGKHVFNASWTVRGDGRAYSIAISHNSASARSLTTFSDAALTISATN
ncbi:hypothetical protein [Serratia sp. (in: enterobacteria)]|uniref:hypothetical protein n=1 Tax=Serratia sp. (in: enterobacteria) TaxID=616 RepID=UPI003989C8CC